MGLSYQWHSDCDEQSACRDDCVCTSGNAPSRNGYSNASLIHHASSEYSYSTSNIDNGDTADEEERVTASANKDPSNCLYWTHSCPSRKLDKHTLGSVARMVNFYELRYYC